MSRSDPTPPMHYRLAVSRDVPTLAGMRWAFRTEEGEVPMESEAAFRERYTAFVGAGIASGQWTYWVAETESGLVAHMAVAVIHSIPRPSRASDQWGYLTDCYTVPAYRSQGVGTALLQHVRAWAVARDLELLLVSPSVAAEPFYRRAGFATDTEFLRLVLRDYDAPPP